MLANIGPGAIEVEQCVSCAAPLSGPYCARCGEHVPEPEALTLSHFLVHARRQLRPAVERDARDRDSFPLLAGRGGCAARAGLVTAQLQSRCAPVENAVQTLKEHPTVILMCGLAFSGKTTLATAMVSELGWAYINLDELNAERGLYGGYGIEAEEWERTHHIALQSLQKELASGNSVVVDDTNCFRWIRDRFRDLSRANHARTTVVLVDTPIHEIEERIAHNRDVRGRKGIRATVFAAHVAAFERPTCDEEVLVYNSNDDPTAWIRRHLGKRRGVE